MSRQLKNAETHQHTVPRWHFRGAAVRGNVFSSSPDLFMYYERRCFALEQLASQRGDFCLSRGGWEDDKGANPPHATDVGMFVVAGLSASFCR